MDNEKNLIGNEVEDTVEETEETVEEIVEEAVEEATETTEEITDEESTEEVVEDVVEEVALEKKILKKVYLCNICGAICEDEVCPECGKELTKEEAYICKSQIAAEKAKKTTIAVVSAIIAVAVIIGAVFAGMYIYKEVYNPYNHGKYKDLTFGDTMGEIAEEIGMDFDELLESNGLPADMGKSTYERVAINYIPVKTQAAQYGVDVKTFIQQVYGLEGEFDENITRGELEEQLTVANAFGLETEEDLASFKTEYGLDESVTLETKFAEIRTDFYKAQYEKQKEAEAAASAEEPELPEESPEATETTETPAEENTSENTEAPAEESAE